MFWLNIRDRVKRIIISIISLLSSLKGKSRLAKKIWYSDRRASRTFSTMLGNMIALSA